MKTLIIAMIVALIFVIFMFIIMKGCIMQIITNIIYGKIRDVEEEIFTLCHLYFANKETIIKDEKDGDFTVPNDCYLMGRDMIEIRYKTLPELRFKLYQKCEETQKRLMKLRNQEKNEEIFNSCFDMLNQMRVSLLEVMKKYKEKPANTIDT